ncbi:MAG TPA: DUF5702 domain-containing protein [Anaerovoracaceae bacterium]|nr:DUF5702 domain-containing protein [Anaerovoracaceae bacterium]
MRKKEYRILNKRGAITIMVLLMFVSLMMLITAFINGSVQRGIGSSTAALGKVWGRSVLGEYDINLQSRYGIFGFYGYDGQIAKKIDTYASHSFAGKKYVRYGGCSSCLEEFSLGKTANFKKQIEEVGRLATAEGMIQGALQPGKITGGYNSEGTHYIRNNAVWQSLPSIGKGAGADIGNIVSFIKSKKSVKELGAAGVGIASQIQYLFNFYRHQMDDKELGETFFNNEIEYVICGERSDSQNKAELKGRIILLREALNLAFLEANPKKRNEALLAAQAITPGPPAMLTMHAIMAVWALLESENDYRLLQAGMPVPFVKTEASWAVDVNFAAGDNRTRQQLNPDDMSEEAKKEKGKKSPSYLIDTGNREGEDYEDYLKVFAYFLGEETRLLRMMDLIQINMKYLYAGDFLIREYNCGLSYSLKVNGRIYEFEETYF